MRATARLAMIKGTKVASALSPADAKKVSFEYARKNAGRLLGVDEDLLTHIKLKNVEFRMVDEVKKVVYVNEFRGVRLQAHVVMPFYDVRMPPLPAPTAAEMAIAGGEGGEDAGAGAGASFVLLSDPIIAALEKSRLAQAAGVNNVPAKGKKSASAKAEAAAARARELSLQKAQKAMDDKKSTRELFTRVDIPLMGLETESDWRDLTSEVPLSPEKYRQLKRDRELDKLGLLTRTDAAASAVPKRRKAAIIAEGLHAAWELAHECRITGVYDVDCYPGIVMAVSQALRRPELPLRSLAACVAWCFSVRRDMRGGVVPFPFHSISILIVSSPTS